MKKYLIFFLVISVVILSGCNKATENKGGESQNQEQKQEQTKKGDISDDVCAEFSAELVGNAMGKEVVKTEGPSMASFYNCRYYFNYDEKTKKGDNILLNLENLDVARQKRGHEIMDRTITTNDKIKMEHFMAMQEDGQINSLYLVLGPNRFISINRSSFKAGTNEDIINLAEKLAEEIK